MRRGTVVVGVMALAGALSLAGAAYAQRPQKVSRIGILFSASPVSEMVGPEPSHRLLRAFLERLRELGYVYGQNLATEPRSAEGYPERHAPLAAELVRLNVDVIFAVTVPGVEAAKEATTTTPIVMLANDPVRLGLVQSLARPGGNVTGFTFDTGPGVVGKRLELLKGAFPGLSRVAYITGTVGWQQTGGEMQEAATKLGVRVVHAEVNSAADYDAAFAKITRERADGLVAGVSALNFVERRRIADFAAARRLPVMHSFREAVEAGALMAYSVDSVDLFRRAADYVDRILKGVKPGDLPVQQPSRFVWSVNLETAKALGVPQSVLGLADELIR